MRIFFLISVFLVLGFSGLTAQTRDIRTKEQELDRIRREIRTLENKLKDSEKREKLTVNRLDDLTKQTTLTRQLLRKLKAEEEEVRKDLQATSGLIAQLEDQVRFRKNHYASYVRSLYKNGRVYDTELLFSSNSLNQLNIRLQYLKRFSEQRRADLKRIAEKKNALERQSLMYESNLLRQRKVITENTSEEQSLRKVTLEREKALQEIRKSRANLASELEQRKRAKQQVEQLIVQLVEREQVRKEREAAERKRKEEEARLAAARRAERPATEALPATPVPAVSTFRPSSLRWPVETGRVTSRFGRQVHPVLKTVTENNGIEITTPAGSRVLAVADAEVSLVTFIAGFGNIVILNHNNGFRTVYGNLSDVLVEENQPLKEGEIVGRSGDSIAGDILHFEIWREREKLNPELWLTRK